MASQVAEMTDMCHHTWLIEIRVLLTLFIYFFWPELASDLHPQVTGITGISHLTEHFQSCFRSC
jgi:hypothetical protein